MNEGEMSVTSNRRSTLLVSPSHRALLQPVTAKSKSTDKQLVGADLAGRLFQIVLALYLIPALLIVLIVGGIGVLVLRVAWLFTESGPPSGLAGYSVRRH